MRSGATLDLRIMRQHGTGFTNAARHLNKRLQHRNAAACIGANTSKRATPPSHHNACGLVTLKFEEVHFNKEHLQSIKLLMY